MCKPKYAHTKNADLICYHTKNPQSKLRNAKISPNIAIKGITLTVIGMLNLCEKNENIKSIASCDVKLIKTKSPKSEKEIPYKDLKVKKSIGERFPTTDIDMLVV